MLALVAADAAVAVAFNAPPTAADALIANVPLRGLYEAVLSPRAKYHNPFDPDEVNVTMTIVAPGATVTISAFWFQDFTLSYSPNETLTPRGKPHWRVRYTPTALGWHKAAWTVTDASGTTTGSTAVFNVTATLPIHSTAGHTPTTVGGFARCSIVDRRRFALEGGVPLYLVGENVCGYETTSNITSTMARWLGRLADHGGNFARVWALDNENTTSLGGNGLLALEKWRIGEYDLRSAWRLDNVLATAERLGVRVLLTLNDQHSFRVDKRWALTPYNAANGGPLRASGDVFTNPAAGEYFARRMRYTAARYGFSTAVFAWELWNEVDFVDGFVGHRASAVAWHTRMAAELKRWDGRHMVTTSMAWEFGDAEVQAAAGLDFTTTHHYSNVSYGPDIAAFMYGIERSKRSAFDMPHFFGEFGLAAKYFDDKGRLPTIAMHNGLWASVAAMAAGAASSWYWSMLVDKYDLYPEFAPVAAFVRGVDPSGRVGAWEPLVAEHSSQWVRALASVGVEATRISQPATTMEAVVWLQNRNATWYKQYEMPAAAIEEVPAGKITLMGLRVGRYSVRWTDTAALATVPIPGEEEEVLCFEGLCEVEAPLMRGADMAAHIVKLG